MWFISVVLNTNLPHFSLLVSMFWYLLDELAQKYEKCVKYTFIAPIQEYDAVCVDISEALYFCTSHLIFHILNVCRAFSGYTFPFNVTKTNYLADDIVIAGWWRKEQIRWCFANVGTCMQFLIHRADQHYLQYNRVKSEKECDLCDTDEN